MNFTNRSDGFLTGEPFPPGWAKIVVTVIHCVCFLVGFPGNLLLLMVFSRRQKTTTNWIVITMAILDIVVFLIQTPMYFINLFPALFVYLGNSLFCRLYFGISFLLSVCTTILFDFLAVDRFFKTTRPHSQMVTERAGKYVCIGIVLITTTCASTYLLSTTTGTRARCIHEKGLIENILPTFRFICSLLSLVLLSGIYFRICSLATRRRLGRLKSDYLSNRRETCGEIKRPSSKNKVQRETSISDTGPENVDSRTGRIDVETKEEKIEKKKSERVYEPDLKDRIQHASGSDMTQSNITEPDITDITTSEDEKVGEGQGPNKVPRQISTISFGGTLSTTPSKSKTNQVLRAGKIDSTTRIIFITIFLFVLSTVIPSIAAFLFVRFVSGRGLTVHRVLIFLLSKLSTLRTIINPVCYFGLSQVFRGEMINMLRKLCSK